MSHFRSALQTLILILATLSAFPVRGSAQAVVLAEGEYITEGGWGVLTISHSGQTPRFSLQAMGANAHVCNLAGDIQGNQATLATQDPATDSPGPSCVVT